MGGREGPGDKGRRSKTLAGKRAAKTRGSPTAHQPKAIPRAPLARERKCLAVKAVKTFCLNGTKLHLCESIDALHKTALSSAPVQKPQAGARQQDQTRMTLKPQKGPTNRAKSASEESEHQTAQTTQQVQSEVEETAKKNVGAKKSAQKQHDAQPEVATTPQGLNETQCPTEGSGQEDVVAGRRKSDEFALRVSDAALLHMAHREPGYLPKVQDEAYELIYESERILCGHIVQIGNVPAVNLARWWRAFNVDGLWFRLQPCGPLLHSKVREYELLPASGPTPDDDVPPKLTRTQTTPPPDYIGPRRRRNRGDAKGSRATAVKPAPQAKGKKRNEVKRIFTELYNSTQQHFKLLSQNIVRGVMQVWHDRKPRLLRNLVEIRRFRRSCGTALHDFRVDAASVVQTSRIERVFSILVREASTRQRRQHVPETFGPSGRLEPSAAGHVVSLRLRLNSWTWDEPPVPWAEDLFGVIWTPHLFGVREEEQVFT